MENINVLLLALCFILDTADAFYPALKDTEEYTILDAYLEMRINNHELNIDTKDIPFDVLLHMTLLRDYLKILCAIYPNSNAIAALSIIDSIIKA